MLDISRSSRTSSPLRFALILALLAGLTGCQWADNTWDGITRLGSGVNSQHAAAEREARREAAAEAIDQARRHHQAGNLDQALLWFHRALEEDRQQLDAHLGIADLYQVQGDYAAAATRYETARQIEPGNFHATYNLGLMYHLMERMQEAVRMYLNALSINPQSYEANFNLATAYLQLDQPSQALPYARRSTDLEPSRQESFVNFGAVLAALGQHHDAIEAYTHAQELGGYSPQLSRNLINAYVRTQQYDLALGELQQAIEHDPDEARYLERLGYVHFRLGNYDRSLESYQHAMQRAQNDPATLNGVGVAFMANYIQGRRQDHDLRDRAVAAWRQSLEINPNQPRIVELISRYGGI